ncbi:MAG: signal peptide peptidase SppA, partial [Bdellovibrionales bacterium]|nr:signal peptide peptidase SppA [Bdellovibrionales bacterium]
MKSFLKSMFSSMLGVFAGVFIAFVILPMILISFVGNISWSVREEIRPKSVLHVLLDAEVVDSTANVDWLFDDGRKRIRLQRIVTALRAAREDKRIVGVVLDIRGPSIGWASATAIRRELLAFKENKKFVYAYADRLNEKGFYLASGAEKTFMQPHGDVEFDGLSTELAFMRGMFSKLEVKPHIFRVGKFKAAVEPFLLDKMSPENREQTAALLDDVWSEVRTGIAERSGGKPEELDAWISELAISSVDSAKKAGLVSELMFSDEFDTLVRGAAGWQTDSDRNFVSVNRMAQEARKRSKSQRKIALVVAEGEIVKGEGGRGLIGDDVYLSSLQEIAEDSDVGAVVLRINSPGGDALASDVMWRQITVLDEKKPVVASLGDIAASGGYYMAVGSRHIVTEPTTITGSIGVFGVLFDAESLFKNKLGVVFDRAATHAHADFGGFARPLQAKEVETIQNSVERTYKRFVQVVAQSRGFEKIEDVEALAEGRVWSGTRAIQLGLADELGGMDRAISKAAELAGYGDDYRLEIYPKSVDRFSRILE